MMIFLTTNNPVIHPVFYIHLTMSPNVVFCSSKQGPVSHLKVLCSTSVLSIFNLILEYSIIWKNKKLYEGLGLVHSVHTTFYAIILEFTFEQVRKFKTTSPVSCGQVSLIPFSTVKYCCNILVFVEGTRKMKHKPNKLFSEQ